MLADGAEDGLGVGLVDAADKVGVGDGDHGVVLLGTGAAIARLRGTKPQACPASGMRDFAARCALRVTAGANVIRCVAVHYATQP
ncbi:hypothetical protein GCM10009777_30530 [Microbacterium pumilum]|uniref:Uncharacterized protein n=1 Tax=Microbacterium pumilum TaxID=344165 RepID=A0ABP5ECX7_9MICO